MLLGSRLEICEFQPGLEFISSSDWTGKNGEFPRDSRITRPCLNFKDALFFHELSEKMIMEA